MGQAEIIVTVPEAAAESTVDQLLAQGFKDLRHGDRRSVPIALWALQWPGKPINANATFETEELAKIYVSHCGDEKPDIIPMCIHSSYKGPK